MSELQTLIRLHKWKLDEKRRALAELQAFRERLEDQKSRLEEEIRAEQDKARVSEAGTYGYGHYARAVIERRRRLDESIAEVERQIAAATEEMAVAFQELKRYELAQESRDRREREKQRRKEAAALDEVGLTGFMRRRGEALSEN